MQDYIPIPAPEDTIAIDYDMSNMVSLLMILEASGYTFIIQPMLKRVLTSTAAAERVAIVWDWRSTYDYAR